MPLSPLPFFLLLLLFFLFLRPFYLVPHPNTLPSTPTSSSKQEVGGGQKRGLDAYSSSPAYAFLLYEEAQRRQQQVDYRRMTRVAISSLREFDEETPVALLRFEKTNELDLLGSKGPLFDFPLPSPKTRGASSAYRMTFLKLHIARLPFRSVLFFDSDVLFFSSPFPLFSLFEPRLLSSRLRFGKETVAAPVAYWLKERPLTSGGPIGVLPSKTLFRDAIDEGVKGERFDGEMDYLIRRFNSTFFPLPDRSIVLVGEFAKDDPAFRALRVRRVEDALTVHFVAHWKPTILSSSTVEKRYGPDSTLSSIYRRWETIDHSSRL